MVPFAAMTAKAQADTREEAHHAVRLLNGVLREGWRIVWHRLGVMTVYTAVVWAACAVVIVPLVTKVLRLLAAYGDVIVGNYSLGLWMLSPQGLGYLIVTGSLMLFAVILSSLLYGIGAVNFLYFGGSILIMGAVALLATAIPAVRASRVDPVKALSYE